MGTVCLCLTDAAPSSGHDTCAMPGCAKKGRTTGTTMALLGFGKLERLSGLLPEFGDDVGFMLDRANLPQRVRRRNPVKSSKNEGESLYDRSPDGALS